MKVKRKKEKVKSFGRWLFTFALCVSPFAFARFAQAQTHTFTLNWQDNATNEDGTKIERCAGAGCASFTEVFSLVGANLMSFKDTVPNSGAGELIYRYRVRAFNTQGFSAYSNIADGTTAKVLTPPNGAPSGLTISAISSSTLELSWADNASNETAQKIRWRQFSPPRAGEIVVAATQTSYRMSGVQKRKTRCATVTAMNDAGESDRSNESCATTRR